MTELDREIRAVNESGAFTMSSITGKLALALVRGSDYAHAGEEEAIELALGPISKSPSNRLLDVGCGIGGTARYVTERGWGQVTGVDIDPDNIVAASARHPGLQFVCCDAAEVPRHLAGPFDVFYAFNAFFLFSDQPGALRAMREIAVTGATLTVFDYVDRGRYVEHQAAQGRSTRRRALMLEGIESMLGGAGWALDRIVPAHREYSRWYEALVARVESMRDAIAAQSSPEFYEFMLRNYTDMRDDIRAGRLGGAIIYANAGT